MKMKSNYYLGLASAILLGFVNFAGAIGVLTGVPLGTAAPPGTLGGWSMTPIGADASPLDSFVTSVGSITFNQAVRHDQIGNGWGTWSHGYAGNVYDTGSSLDPTSLTLTMGGPTSAIYFYTEPVNFDNFTFTATTDSGATLTQTVNGDGGASGFGFYATGSDFISSITVTGTDADGFAIGEFGLNNGPGVPEGGYSLGYLVMALVVCGAAGSHFNRQKKATT
jgi:hypothetical protein